MAAALPDILYAQLADYCRRNQIAYLALFGSAVRGEQRAGSHIDLLVEFAPSLPRRADRLSGAGANAALRAETTGSPRSAATRACCLRSGRLFRAEILEPTA